MKWLRVLADMWSGDFWKEEHRKSKEALEDARRAVSEGRAMLDGEDYWLIPPGKGCHCDYPKK